MICARRVTKTYLNAGNVIPALDAVDLSVNEGDFVVVHGSSGSGKTTLLLTLGGMLRPTSGTVMFRERDIYALSPRRRSRFRQRHVGFIFQKFFLLPYLTACDNIRLGLTLHAYQGDHEQQIVQLAQRLGIAHRLNHRPAQLSVGEQQRVAMARATAGAPELLLADEPTGNLDQANSTAFADFLLDENAHGRTIVLVTHDEGLLRLGSRTVKLRSGSLVDSA